MRFSALLLFFYSFCASIHAQDRPIISSAKEEVRNLKNGAMVVRLYMNKPKTDLLKKSIAGAENNKEKNELEKMLTTHLLERDIYKQKVIHACTDHYDFSSIYFVHDYDFQLLKNGERKGFFLNKMGESDPSIMMSSDHYLILARGQNDDEVVIIAPDNRPLPSSFPTKYSRGIGSLFNMIFQPRDKLSEGVEKLNLALKKYYQKMMQG